MAPRVVDSIAEMQAYARDARRAGKAVGFVPTMGALHDGHASLLRRARAENDVCVASIFVNPLQFGPNEDFSKYPRTLDADRAVCGSAGVDVIFTTTPEAMYAPGFSTCVLNDELSSALCGRSRPSHFKGVLTVVAKLFNIVHPARAYFGQKDYQQCLLIERMARDLNFDLEVIRMPIVREPSGLAMSSRNAYLSAEEKTRALCLKKALERAESLLRSGNAAPDVQREIARFLAAQEGIRVDYAEVVDAGNLLAVTPLTRTILVALAAFVGSTRLIDNVLADVK